jgi:1-acyl-sn-glycerol-3-phosphate acyltransferase
MNCIRKLAAWIYGCHAWIVLSIVTLLCGSLVALLRKPSYGRPIAHYAARALFRLVALPMSIRGLDRLPHRPHVLLVNHTSFLDAIVLTALLPARPGYAFVARQQYRSQSLLCPLLKGLGTVVLRQRDPRRKSPNTALLRLKLRQGSNLIIFPEGGILPEEGLGHFHSGAFVAAAKERVPIVIAGLRGTRAALQLGTWLPRRVEVALEIGPVLIPGNQDEHAISRLRDTAHEAMLPLTGESDLET